MTNEQLIILLAGLSTIITTIGVIVGKIKICNSRCSNCIQDTTVPDVESAVIPPPNKAPTPQPILVQPRPQVIFP